MQRACLGGEGRVKLCPRAGARILSQVHGACKVARIVGHVVAVRRSASDILHDRVFAGHGVGNLVDAGFKCGIIHADLMSVGIGDRVVRLELIVVWLTVQILHDIQAVGQIHQLVALDGQRNLRIFGHDIMGPGLLCRNIDLLDLVVGEHDGAVLQRIQRMALLVDDLHHDVVAAVPDDLAAFQLWLNPVDVGIQHIAADGLFLLQIIGSVGIGDGQLAQGHFAIGIGCALADRIALAATVVEQFKLHAL